MTFSHKEIISKSKNDTFKTGYDLGKLLKAPVLIGLDGELGAGKTIFAKGIAASLGIQYEITSPSFLGISEYYSDKVSFIHMDFYKKAVPLELITDYLNKPSIVLIEWYKNYKEVFNKELSIVLCVYIEYLKNKAGEILNNQRKIIIQPTL